MSEASSGNHSQFTNQGHTPADQVLSQKLPA